MVDRGKKAPLSFTSTPFFPPDDYYVVRTDIVFGPYIYICVVMGSHVFNGVYKTLLYHEDDIKPRGLRRHQLWHT